MYEAVTLLCKNPACYNMSYNSVVKWDMSESPRYQDTFVIVCTNDAFLRDVRDLVWIIRVEVKNNLQIDGFYWSANCLIYFEIILKQVMSWTRARRKVGKI